MNIWQSTRRHAEDNFILASLILLILFFGFSSDNFFSVITLTTILNQLPALTVVTVGMTLVLIVAGIDLSVGSVMGCRSPLCGRWGLPWMACLMGLGTGLICGVVNGLLVAYFSLPSFIVTLGMLEMARGLAYVTTGSQTVYIGPQIQSLALPLPGIGVSAALISAIVLVITAQFVLTRTVLGRYLVAIGTNAQAARMSGIDPRPYRLMVLAVSRTCGIAGMSTHYLGSADPNAGIGWAIAIAAAAGGTSLMVVMVDHRRLRGVLIIAVLQNGLAQIGVSEPTKRLITGAVIIIAVLIDRWRAKHASAS
jgi:ribose transport system permease protein